MNTETFIVVVLTADVVLETLPHKLYGAATILPRALDNPPRETSFLKSIKPKKDIIIFPQAKSTDFKLTLPSKSDTVPSFASSRGTFHHYSESFHPPTSNKRPESFYNTNIAKSPISEKPNTSSSRNVDSVTVNLSNSPQEKPWLHNKLKRQPSTTSLGDSKDSSAYAKLPAALEPEPVKSYDPTVTSSTTGISKNVQSRLSSVNIPQTAQPIIISPEVCRSVNVKSRTDASSLLEINRVTNHDNTGIETPLNELNEEHNPIRPKETESQNRVFETLPLTEANVSKQSHDIILTNTPNTLDATAQSPFTNCQTNDDVSLPVSRQDSTIHNDSSVDATTPLPTIVDETAGNVEATEDVDSNMEDISSENKKLQMADIDLI